MAKSDKQRARDVKLHKGGGSENRGKKAGKGAVRPGSAFRKSNAADKTGRTGPGGEKDVKAGTMTHMRTENTINRLQMYRMKTKELSREQQVLPARIQPDRRWFGNTRVIAQNKMQAFRETLSKGVEDPFSVVLRSSKLPMSLLRETEEKASRMNLLSVEPFAQVFGKGRHQKRAKLGSYDLEGLMQSVSQKTQGYVDAKEDRKSTVDHDGLHKIIEEKYAHAGEEIFNKGTSKRIWGELYKVVDSSDVIVFVLDARDPMGTRCLKLEKDIRKNKPGKHIVLLLNKVDLIPTWAARKWVQTLTKDFPTLAFHASITNPFGKNALLNLLRQFGVLIKERKNLTIGFIGYPNVGKSSVINTMKRKKVCKAAPIPGETRVWQYIALTKKLYMLDCPGIVPATNHDHATDTSKVLKGVVRPERIKDPSQYIDEVVVRVKKQYLIQRYKLPADSTWEDGTEFLTLLANKMGKLRKGGDPDLEITARVVLCDWQRGRIPFFTAPPEKDEAPAAAVVTITGKTSDEMAAAAAAAAASSSSSAPAAAATKEETVTVGANEDGSAAPAEVTKVTQSLTELACCSVMFDEEDRRGDALPVEQETKAERLNRKEAKLLAGRRKRKGGGGDKGGESSDEEAEAPAAAPRLKKKKKIRRGGGGGASGASAKASASKEAGAGSGMAVTPASMDWKAVVAEFDM